MNAFHDISFFFILFLSFIPAIILALKGKNRQGYILAVSALIVFLLYLGHGRSLLYFLVYLAVEWLVLRIYLDRKLPGIAGKRTYEICLALTILPLVLVKASGLFEIISFEFLGMSYISFRVIQILIESHDGLITDLKLSDYLTFLLFFPTITSGPIDRSRRFIEDLQKKFTKEEYCDLLATGLFKFLLGLVYKFGFSSVFYVLMGKCAMKYGMLLYLYTYSITYSLYLFFDFAGYSLMAVGASYVFGIRTPDNFRYPFLSLGIKDFWNRWHITLSYWFRDYIFSRITYHWIKIKKFSSKLQTAFFAYVINMFIMGMWHGLDISYIAYGLYHGLLLGLHEVWQKKLPFSKKYKKKLWYKILAWIVCMHLVMFGFFLFSGAAIPFFKELLR